MLLPRRFDLDNFFDIQTTDTNMKCDIYEKDGSYFIEADMPGVDKSDVKVDFDNGYLSISAEKNVSNEEEGKDFIRQERFSGSTMRKFYVGDVDEEKITASFAHGVLTVEVPKEDVKKSNKSIEIN